MSCLQPRLSPGRPRTDNKKLVAITVSNYFENHHSPNTNSWVGSFCWATSSPATCVEFQQYATQSIRANMHDAVDTRRNLSKLERFIRDTFINRRVLTDSGSHSYSRSFEQGMDRDQTGLCYMNTTLGSRVRGTLNASQPY